MQRRERSERSWSEGGRERTMTLPKQLFAIFLSALLIVTMTPPTAVSAQDQQQQQQSAAPASDDQSNYVAPEDDYAPLTADELDAVVAPIALYPDALVAQVLGAASFPDQITTAAFWLRDNSNLKGDALAKAVDAQDWDPAVKALTQFPTVLDTLAKNLAWTSTLGEAAATQQAEVMAAVQRMRAKALAAGNLKTSSEIKVVQEAPQTIVIQPANPQVIYVPQYNPTVIYGAPVVVPNYSAGDVAAAAVISFGAGVALGAMLSNGCNRWTWGWGCWGTNWAGNTIIYQRNVYYGNPYWRGGYYRPPYRPGYPSYGRPPYYRPPGNRPPGYRPPNGGRPPGNGRPPNGGRPPGNGRPPGGVKPPYQPGKPPTIQPVPNPGKPGSKPTPVRPGTNPGNPGNRPGTRPGQPTIQPVPKPGGPSPRPGAPSTRPAPTAPVMRPSVQPDRGYPQAKPAPSAPSPKPGAFSSGGRPASVRGNQSMKSSGGSGNRGGKPK